MTLKDKIYDYFTDFDYTTIAISELLSDPDIQALAMKLGCELVQLQMAETTLSTWDQAYYKKKRLYVISGFGEIDVFDTRVFSARSAAQAMKYDNNGNRVILCFQNEALRKKHFSDYSAAFYKFCPSL